MEPNFWPRLKSSFTGVIIVGLLDIGIKNFTYWELYGNCLFCHWFRVEWCHSGTVILQGQHWELQRQMAFSEMRVELSWRLSREEEDYCKQKITQWPCSLSVFSSSGRRLARCLSPFMSICYSEVSCNCLIVATSRLIVDQLWRNWDAQIYKQAWKWHT